MFALCIMHDIICYSIPLPRQSFLLQLLLLSFLYHWHQASCKHQQQHQIILVDGKTTISKIPAPEFEIICIPPCQKNYILLLTWPVNVKLVPIRQVARKVNNKQEQVLHKLSRQHGVSQITRCNQF